MTVEQVEVSILHAQLEFHRHDKEALNWAHTYLVRALVQLEEVRHPHVDTTEAAIARVLAGEGT